VFDLVFVRDEPELQEEGWSALEGRIALGDFAEHFLAPLGPWARSDYERHWVEAARRLLAGADRTAFITSAFQFWWPMWREGSEVFVQEQLLWGQALAASFDPLDVYASIPERVTTSEDGEVSEWRIRVRDVEEFVARRAGSYVPT
jgi:hypothetical protein